jgi:phage anti-repressor protein
MDSDTLEIFKETFSTEKQQQFLVHFQMYLVHGDDNSKHVVDLDLVYEWMGFTRKNNAKRMLTKSFDVDTDYSVNVLLLPKEQQTRGGHNKEMVLMSVPTFKSLCMMSNTERGKQTRTYYLSMERVFFKHTQQKLAKQAELLDQMKSRLMANELVGQQKLIEAYHQKPCVYVIRVSDKINDSFVVKIGETDDIQTRIRTHRCDFDVCVLLDAIGCPEAHKLEQYILKRPDIMARRLPGTETIQLDKEFSIEKLTKIIKTNACNFNGIIMSAADKLSQDRMATLRCILNSDLDLTKKTEMIDYVMHISSQVHKETSASHTDASGFVLEPESSRRIYKYSLDDLTTPIGVFNSLREAARSTRNPNVHDHHIRDACNQNTVVEGHRWICVDKHCENPLMSPPTSIAETFDPSQIIRKHQKKLGKIAQICPDAKRIINVYACVNDAASAISLSACTVSLSLHKNTKAGNFYWKLLSECNDDLRATFIGPLPGPTVRRVGCKPVLQIDPKDRNVIEIHDSQQVVASKFKICAKKINDLCRSGDIYKGFIWAHAE